MGWRGGGGLREKRSTGERSWGLGILGLGSVTAASASRPSDQRQWSLLSTQAAQRLQRMLRRALQEHLSTKVVALLGSVWPTISTGE